MLSQHLFTFGMCTLPGADTATLVIAASIDYKSHGEEALGSGLFLGKAQLFAPALKSLDRHDTIGVAQWWRQRRGRN